MCSVLVGWFAETFQIRNTICFTLNLSTLFNSILGFLSGFAKALVLFAYYLRFSFQQADIFFDLIFGVNPAFMRLRGPLKFVMKRSGRNL